MFSKELFFLIFIIILLIILITFMLYRERFSEESNPDCICAFDIDGTITTGIDRAAQAISRAKELGCKIAINTARPSKWYSDLDLRNLGLKESDFDSDFYHGEPFKCSFTDIKCFEDSIATTKVNHLHTLSKKWNIKPSRIILFDDQWPNIEKAKQAGFATVYANYHLGGLPDNVVMQINTHLETV
jgi:hypothetical protein